MTDEEVNRTRSMGSHPDRPDQVEEQPPTEQKN